jgi:hypothetical protein
LARPLSFAATSHFDYLISGIDFKHLLQGWAFACSASKAKHWRAEIRCQDGLCNSKGGGFEF